MSCILFIEFPVGRHSASGLASKVGYGHWDILLLQNGCLLAEIKCFVEFAIFTALLKYILN